MTRRPFETEKLLTWLGEILQHADAVDVDVVVLDRENARSSVRITVRDVPGPLGGFQVEPQSEPARQAFGVQ